MRTGKYVLLSGHNRLKIFYSPRMNVIILKDALTLRIILLQRCSLPF